MRRNVMGGIGLLLLSLIIGPALAQTTPPAPPQQPTGQATQAPPAPPAEAETPHCYDCHDLAKPFAANPHARGMAKNHEVPNATCESCHGDGKAHMEAGGDTSLIFKPVGVAGANKACLACHDVSSDRISRHAGFHANSAAVNCLTCHSIHHSDPSTTRLLVKPQLALCSSCHASQVASFRSKPYAHRLGRGGMQCSSCHEPHGRPGKENVRMTAAGEAPCLNCHSDKRGPFVFAHPGLHAAQTETQCLNCHEVHGSNNPRMLKRATVWQLCIECHSPTASDTFGSQPPSFHNLNTPRYRNCTGCHTAIHGSNRDPQLFK